MSNRPPLSWNAVLRDLHADRALVAPVRELSCTPGIFAWRGVSGTRYAVTPKARDLVPADAVVVAVAREANKAGSLIAVAAFDADATGFDQFRLLAHAAGATELQIHSLTETAKERAAVVADLASEARVDASAFAAAPLATSGSYDRRAIMAAACALVRTRQAVTGEPWAACIGSALKAAWAAAKAARARLAH